MSTIFNKIINKEIPADIIYENETVLCFKDINPIAPIHLLIIPKKEIPTVNDIKNDDKELMGDLFIAAKEVAKLLKIDENGYPKKRENIFSEQLKKSLGKRACHHGAGLRVLEPSPPPSRYA